MFQNDEKATLPGLLAAVNLKRQFSPDVRLLLTLLNDQKYRLCASAYELLRVRDDLQGLLVSNTSPESLVDTVRRSACESPGRYLS